MKEQEQFNNGFHEHQNSLEKINKVIPTKNHKEVVDYHYRFKIPDQFKKYRSHKREQAQRMMEKVERRRYDDIMGRVLNWNDSTPQTSTSGNVVRKVHEW